MNIARRVVIKERDEETVVYSYWNYRMEIESAKRLIGLRFEHDTIREEIEEAIERVEKEEKIELAPEQREAVILAVSSGSISNNRWSRNRKDNYHKCDNQSILNIRQIKFFSRHLQEERQRELRNRRDTRLRPYTDFWSFPASLRRNGEKSILTFSTEMKDNALWSVMR